MAYGQQAFPARAPGAEKTGVEAEPRALVVATLARPTATGTTITTTTTTTTTTAAAATATRGLFDLDDSMVLNCVPCVTMVSNQRRSNDSQEGTWTRGLLKSSTGSEVIYHVGVQISELRIAAHLLQTDCVQQRHKMRDFSSETATLLFIFRQHHRIKTTSLKGYVSPFARHEGELLQRKVVAIVSSLCAKDQQKAHHEAEYLARVGMKHQGAGGEGGANKGGDQGGW